MASILFSFVGMQDPESDKTKEEGSIVTLIKHLLSENKTIKYLILLYTIGEKGTAERAKLTQEWLIDVLENSPFTKNNIKLIPLNQAVSNDPINLSLIIEEIKNYYDNGVKKLIQTDDILELNASSATPAMKSAFTALQASGYFTKSNLWQVRNPQEMLEEQQRVFQTNVDILKQEFDINVIKKQVENYNYRGALATLEKSSINNDKLKSLLEYGNYRLSLNFQQAYQNKNQNESLFDKNRSLVNDINKLNEKKQSAILKEIYYHILVRNETKEYAQFLILTFSFQELVLTYLIRKYIQSDLLEKSWDLDIKKATVEQCKKYDNSQLQQSIPRIYNLEYLSRPVMLEIIKYKPFACPSAIIEPLESLNSYCQKRNEIIHQFEGVSQDDLKENDMQEIITNIQNILTELFAHSFNQENSFTVLNRLIKDELHL